MDTHETKHRELLGELARSEDFVQSLETQGGGYPFGALQHAADEFYVFDLAGRIVDVNPRACTQLGFRREELIGKSVWEISTRQTEGGFEKLVAAIEMEGPQYLFGHNRRKDGSTYAVEARLWRAEHDGTPRVFGLLRDADGHQGLIEERDQLISLIENSAEAITVATPENVCTYMNPAGREMLGLASLEEVVGKSLSDLVPEELREHFAGQVAPRMHAGRWQGELVFRSFPGGSQTPCWVNAFAIKLSQTGEVIGRAVIAHDISERKAAERHRQKLLELNEVSRNVATSLLGEDDLNRAVGIILRGVGQILNVSRSYLCRYREDRSWVFRTHQWTAGDGESYEVEAKPEAAETYGWATEILAQGQPIRLSDVHDSGFVPSEDSGVLRPDVHALLVLPVMVHGRLESFFGFVDTGAPREWEDEELAILQIIVDSFARAVERRIAERERAVIAHDLEKSVARERAANRYKSEFLANMSHELRTPMNSIVGYADLLSRPNVDDEKQAVWIGHIRRSTSYLLSLINDVLDLSKIEAGQMQVSKELCSLRELVASVKELLKGQATEKLLEYRFEYVGDVPEKIVTDPIRLRQILVNLVGNAIKFTKEGCVSVLVSTSTEGDRRQLRIEVVDTGIGIEPEALERLFRPFAQVRASDDSRFGGTGLGLDISRHLARLLGGEIDVVSEVGKGSVFTLRLDLEAELEEELLAGPSSAALGDEAPSLVGRRILIVDDCPENREILGFLLTESGAHVDAAEDGARGVEVALAGAAAGRPHDLVLMDMNMPVKDGYQATRELIEAGFERPIIALTAYALAGDEERCLSAGCVAYIAKPVLPAHFFGTIVRHLQPGEREREVAASQEETGEDVLRSLADNPRFQPLVDRYVANFSDLLVELRSYFEADDLEAFRTRVHRLRGTASNYGFPDISRAAGRCEDLVRMGSGSDEIESALRELEEHLRDASRNP
jgi:PAS domain S-box-containing protein